MEIYQTKRRWKIALAIVAALIVIATMVLSRYFVDRIAQEERKKIEVWAGAITNKAKLIQKTDKIFKEFAVEDRKHMQLLAEANKFIAEYDGDGDISFPTKVISNNTNIPIIIVDATGNISFFNNFPNDSLKNRGYLQRKLDEFKMKYPPIDVSYKLFGRQQKQWLYYDDSYIYYELKETIDDLVQSFISETVVNSASVPVIFTNASKDSIIAKGNLEELKVDLEHLSDAEIIANMQGYNMMEVELEEGTYNYIFYRDSYIISLLRYSPIFLIGVAGSFLLVSYLLFSTARRSEQNKVWVGMSKETAHQLGTPLSSLVGWIELLRLKEVDESILSEMQKDINRLNMVADRFSKIGSLPELKNEQLIQCIEEVVNYMRPRTSSKIQISSHYDIEPSTEVAINKQLFGWVIENLFRNAIDAISGEGKIEIEVTEKAKLFCIDVSDTGKGIPKNQFKTVFRPGHTTKKRGWGLGLSLSKRIIEEYHKGKISVKQSEVGAGTTFRILLKKIQTN